MTCPNCDKLRRALSPLEDRSFTEEFLRHVPMDAVRSRVQAGVKRITLTELWEMTWPHKRPDSLALTKLGRSLDGLGWRRTKFNGKIMFYPEV